MILVSSSRRWAWLFLVLAATSGCVSAGRVVVEWNTCVAVEGGVCDVESDK